MRKIYEALEKLDGGADVIALIKKEVEARDSAEAAQRLALKEFKGIVDKIKGLGVNVDDIESLIKTGGKDKTELEKQISTLTKQFESMQKALQEERVEKERISSQAKIDRLKADVLPEFQQAYDKYAPIMVDDFISKGKLKYDESGKVVYNLSNGVFERREGFALINKEYPVVPKNNGSGLPLKGSSLTIEGFDFGKDKTDYSSMSTHELFEIAMSEKK